MNKRIEYVEKGNLSLGACVRRAAALGRDSKQPFRLNIVKRYGYRGPPKILGVEVFA